MALTRRLLAAGRSACLLVGIVACSNEQGVVHYDGPHQRIAQACPEISHGDRPQDWTGWDVNEVSVLLTDSSPAGEEYVVTGTTTIETTYESDVKRWSCTVVTSYADNRLEARLALLGD